jgi:hypothetical protein
MTVFSYIVAHDTGFAPNPFGGVCTLACCKPRIRLTAEKGDLVIGLSPKAKGNRIVYMMRVTEQLSFAEYWRRSQYRCKRPSLHSSDPERRCGDNIYRPLGADEFQQQPSRHSNPDGTENECLKTVDLGGKHVLVSDEFAYFGSEAIRPPKSLHALVVARGHRKFTESAFTQKVEKFFDELPKGLHGLPLVWRLKEEAKKSTPRCCCRQEGHPCG